MLDYMVDHESESISGILSHAERNLFAGASAFQLVCCLGRSIDRRIFLQLERVRLQLFLLSAGTAVLVYPPFPSLAIACSYFCARSWALGSVLRGKDKLFSGQSVPARQESHFTQSLCR